MSQPHVMSRMLSRRHCRLLRPQANVMNWRFSRPWHGQLVFAPSLAAKKAGGQPDPYTHSRLSAIGDENSASSAIGLARWATRMTKQKHAAAAVCRTTIERDFIVGKSRRSEALLGFCRSPICAGAKPAFPSTLVLNYQREEQI